MNTSTQKLVTALEQLRRTRSDAALDEIIDLARREQFHDYEGTDLFPANDLIRRLKIIGFTDDDTIIRDVKKGQFSATEEESDAWLQEPRS